MSIFMILILFLIYKVKEAKTKEKKDQEEKRGSSRRRERPGGEKREQ